MGSSRKGPDGLTDTQRKFVEAFSGNVEEAAKAAGLTYDYCRHLITMPHIQSAIAKREEQNPRTKKRIAKRSDRLAFWTKIMEDPDARMTDRLKASELLGKANCDFSEKRIIEGGDKPVGVSLVPQPELDSRIDRLVRGDDEDFLK